MTPTSCLFPLMLLVADASARVEYRYYADRQNWPTAVQQCPLRWPGSQLARITDDADYTNLATIMVRDISNPEDIYQGAWVGLNAIDSTNQQTPSPAGVPATGWRWVEGTDWNGALATPEQLEHWGPLGTGYSGDTGECESGAYPAGNECTGSPLWQRAQPDNSGGSQRCVLIAVGALPPTLTSPFYDDQQCGGGVIGGVDNSHAFICERSVTEPAPPYFPPPAPAPAVIATKDPHFRFAHGGRADIRGQDGATYNFLSARNISMNVQFEAADFVWSHRTVHGTKMRRAFWTLRLPLGQLVTIAVDAESVHSKTGFKASVVTPETETKPAVVVNENTPFSLPGLKVSILNRKLTIATTTWQLSATANSFPFASLNKGKVLLDVEATPIYDVDADAVAPHGLFGQSFDRDDVAVDGAVDTNRTNDVTTVANGEGAIEGTIDDYQVDDNFSTDFKYSRFDKTEAKPRDVTKLSGHKRAKGFLKVAAAHHNEA